MSSTSPSRGDLEAMDRDELVDVVLDLSEEVAELRESVERESQKRERADDYSAEKRAELRAEMEEMADAFRADHTQTDRERSKLARRVSVIEDELGIEASDALAIGEGGADAQHLSKLGRLVRHGPEAVSDRPTKTMYRAREMVQNWAEWGFVTHDGSERILASRKHDLRTHLQDARDEKLQWTQVYRAMELVDEWSGAHIQLKDGDNTQGKYVLHYYRDGGGR